MPLFNDADINSQARRIADSEAESAAGLAADQLARRSRVDAIDSAAAEFVSKANALGFRPNCQLVVTWREQVDVTRGLLFKRHRTESESREHSSACWGYFVLPSMRRLRAVVFENGAIVFYESDDDDRLYGVEAATYDAESNEIDDFVKDMLIALAEFSLKGQPIATKVRLYFGTESGVRNYQDATRR